MRGATLFFSALLVVVGTGRCVCLRSNLNNVVIVEEEPVASCSAARKRPQNRLIVLGWFFRQIGVKIFDICFKCIHFTRQRHISTAGFMFLPADTIRQCEFSDINDDVFPLSSFFYHFKCFNKPQWKFRKITFPLGKVLQYWSTMISTLLLR